MTHHPRRSSPWINAALAGTCSLAVVLATTTSAAQESQSGGPGSAPQKAGTPAPQAQSPHAQALDRTAPDDRPTAAEVAWAKHRAIEYIWNQQRPSGRWRSKFEMKHRRASTALAGFALISSGEKRFDHRFGKAIESIQDRSRIQSIYSRSMTLLFWYALGSSQNEKQIETDVRFLSMQQHADGGWGGKLKIECEPDHFHSRIALLALATAADQGADVSPLIFRRAEEYWLTTQLPDGGWGYATADEQDTGDEKQNAQAPAASYGSPTAAGIASLDLIEQQLYRKANLPFNGRFAGRCARDVKKTRPLREARQRAWRWLESHPSLDTIPGQTPAEKRPFGDSLLSYYLFNLAAISNASGQCRAGKQSCQDVIVSQLLHTQSAEGGWGDAHESCYALLALHIAAQPVLMQKLRHDAGTDWNTAPHDLANLTRWLDKKDQDARVGTWQVVDLAKDPEGLGRAPFLLITGHHALALSDAQKSALQHYVYSGGTIIGVACCSKKEFSDSFQDLARHLFPDFSAGPLPPDHPVWNAPIPIRPGEDVLGFCDRCRTAVFLLTNGACTAWNQMADEKYERLFNIPANIIAYSQPVWSAVNRDDRFIPSQPQPPAVQRLRVARVRTGGDWWINRSATEHLSAGLARLIGMQIEELDPITWADAGSSDADVLWLTGSSFAPLQDAEQQSLQTYLDHGGTLLTSAMCGEPKFEESLQVWAAERFGVEHWQRITEADPLITGQFAPSLAGNLTDIHVTSPELGGGTTRMDWPVLYGLRHNDRWAIIYSPFDLTTALSNQACHNCVGYAKSDAVAVAGNVLLYVTRNEADASQASGKSPIDLVEVKRAGDSGKVQSQRSRRHGGRRK